MNISIFLVVFGVVFVAELPDKSMFASLALSTKFKKSYVWMGAAAAFLVHVIIAVTAGHFLTLLPKQVLEYIVGGLFLLGAGLLLFGKDEDESEERASLDAHAEATKKVAHSFLRVFTTSFIVIFLGEWGDITQIAVANYAAKYHDIVSVGLGAVFGLWSVAAFGIIVGSKILERIPARKVQIGIGFVLLLFAAFSIISAIRQ